MLNYKLAGFVWTILLQKNQFYFRKCICASRKVNCVFANFLPFGMDLHDIEYSYMSYPVHSPRILYRIYYIINNVYIILMMYALHEVRLKPYTDSPRAASDLYAGLVCAQFCCVYVCCRRNPTNEVGMRFCGGIKSLCTLVDSYRRAFMPVYIPYSYGISRF